MLYSRAAVAILQIENLWCRGTVASLRTFIRHVAKSRLGSVRFTLSYYFPLSVLIKKQQTPKSQNCFSMQSLCCITCYYGYTQQSQAFIFDILCDGVEAERLTFKETSGLSFNFVHQISQLSVSKRSLSTAKDPNGKELSETNR